MTMDSSSMYWQTNDEWFRINKNKDCYELTEKAPPEAIESFNKYNELSERAEKERELGIYR